jgi:hypothetical protein
MGAKVIFKICSAKAALPPEGIFSTGKVRVSLTPKGI